MYRWISIEWDALVDELWPDVLGLDAPDVLPLLHHGRPGRVRILDGAHAYDAQYPRGGDGDHLVSLRSLS